MDYATRFTSGDYMGDLEGISEEFLQMIEDEDATEDYSLMRIEKLKDLLHDRRLPMRGDRKQLISYLERYSNPHAL